MTYILTAAEVLTHGLVFVGFAAVVQQRMKHDNLLKEFRAHFGSSPIDISQIWYDMQTTTLGNPLLEKEKSAKGFKMLMAAMYFLWSHPKNARLLGSRFNISTRTVHSDDFWKWIYKISALVSSKIVWDPRFDSDDYSSFILSIDGVDFNVWEKPNERYNVDKGLCSHKSKHGALRYLIALSIWESKCVYIHGPVKAGDTVDIAQWRLDLKGRMLELPAGKMAIADRGYQTSEPDEVGLLSIPNNREKHSSVELHRFKTRARQRHEGFNSRLKHFKILQDVFRFSWEKHRHVFQAVVVIVQYQLDSGTPLFDV